MALGIIGGSGLYAMDGLKVVETREVSTPFGPPSSPLTMGEIESVPVVFLARHGPNHTRRAGHCVSVIHLVSHSNSITRWSAGT